jgi:hypothetical protein
MNDFTHNIVNNKPNTNIIILDKSAQILLKIFPLINPLNISNPPRNTNIPINTTMCIKNFFLSEYFFANIEKIIIGIPKTVGIREVKD